MQPSVIRGILIESQLEELAVFSEASWKAENAENECGRRGQKSEQEAS